MAESNRVARCTTSPLCPPPVPARCVSCAAFFFVAFGPPGRYIRTDAGPKARQPPPPGNCATMPAATPPRPADTDRNLLFGVLALQAGLIDQAQLIEACTLWTTRKQIFLGDLLVEGGWLTPTDRDHVDYLVQRSSQRHKDDARAGLEALANPDVRRSLAGLEDAAIQEVLASLSPPGAGGSSTGLELPPAHQRYLLRD